MLINAGIQKVVYLQGYADNLSMEMLAEAGVKTYLFDDLGDKNSGGS
jgi:dCMP deaminase